MRERGESKISQKAKETLSEGATGLDGEMSGEKHTHSNA